MSLRTELLSTGPPVARACGLPCRHSRRLPPHYGPAFRLRSPATTNAAALNRKNVPGSGTAVAAAQKRKSQIGQVAGLARGASDVPSGRLEARGPLLTPKNA